MNERSLILKSQKMARTVDETKIEKIREAAIQLVVSEGYGGASVSKIAKLAGVAEGYLYRYHASKNDLINSLLRESITRLMNQIEALLEQNRPVAEIVAETVKILFALATRDTPRMKFIYVLVNDYNFAVDEALRIRTIDICSRIQRRGTEAGDLAADIAPEDIYLMAVSAPIQFINQRLKNSFGQTELDDAACQKAINMTIKALTV